MNISRRNLLKLGAGTSAMWLTGGLPLHAADKPRDRKIPVGLQLYSVRHACEKDLPKVLAAVAPNVDSEEPLAGALRNYAVLGDIKLNRGSASAQ